MKKNLALLILRKQFSQVIEDHIKTVWSPENYFDKTQNLHFSSRLPKRLKKAFQICYQDQQFKKTLTFWQRESQILILHPGTLDIDSFKEYLNKFILILTSLITHKIPFPRFLSTIFYNFLYPFRYCPI